MRSGFIILMFLAATAYLMSNWVTLAEQGRPWTEVELETIRSLWIGSLPPLPADPTNAVADLAQAAAFGHRLFFDTRFSSNGRVACSTCHQPEKAFTDGLAVSVGIGAVTKNAMSLIGAAYSPWYFWDGRKDSLWSQALGPLENPLEHGSDRRAIAAIVAADAEYRERYEALFGPLPDPGKADERAISRVFTNLGKVLAAYQRLLLPGASRFDRYAASILEDSTADAVTAFGPLERRGLQLFIGRGQCVNCHNGPLLTNNDFHNTGSLSGAGQLPSRGRIMAVEQILEDPFNCLSAFSDESDHRCEEVRFMKTGDELMGAHRTPSLRNVSRTGPYMHAGQLDSLQAVVEQYNRGAEAMIGHNEAKPLELSAGEKASLVAFLKTLEGPVAAEQKWLVP